MHSVHRQLLKINMFLHSKKRLYIISLTWPPVAAILFDFGWLVDNQLAAGHNKSFQILLSKSIQKIELNSHGVTLFSEKT